MTYLMILSKTRPQILKKMLESPVETFELKSKRNESEKSPQGMMSVPRYLHIIDVLEGKGRQPDKAAILPPFPALQ